MPTTALETARGPKTRERLRWEPCKGRGAPALEDQLDAHNLLLENEVVAKLIFWLRS